jgi:hypothetical protein
MDTEEAYSVTAGGQRLAEEFRKEVLDLPENQDVARTLDDVVSNYARLDTTDLMNRVYQMRVRTVADPGERAVSDVPPFEDFTEILDHDAAVQELYLPPSWETTLALTFDGDAQQRMHASIRDTFGGKVYGLETLWTSLPRFPCASRLSTSATPL